MLLPVINVVKSERPESIWCYAAVRCYDAYHSIDYTMSM